MGAPDGQDQQAGSCLRRRTWHFRPEQGFTLGCVVIYGHDAGRADKVFSDNLESTAKEIHAVDLDSNCIKGIPARFHHSLRRQPGGMIDMVMMNRVGREGGSTPSALYGRCLVETVSTGLKPFKKNVGLPDIRNVHVLVDFHEQHQNSKDFWCIVRNARQSHGHFMGVGHVTMVDSAASRLMQLADLVAASRNWAGKMGIGVEHLEEQCGILCR